MACLSNEEVPREYPTIKPICNKRMRQVAHRYSPTTKGAPVPLCSPSECVTQKGLDRLPGVPMCPCALSAVNGHAPWRVVRGGDPVGSLRLFRMHSAGTGVDIRHGGSRHSDWEELLCNWIWNDSNPSIVTPPSFSPWRDWEEKSPPPLLYPGEFRSIDTQRAFAPRENPSETDRHPSQRLDRADSSKI